jgi:hypothetical protein
VQSEEWDVHAKHAAITPGFNVIAATSNNFQLALVDFGFCAKVYYQEPGKSLDLC